MSGIEALSDELLQVIAEEDPLNDALEGYKPVAELLGDPSAATQRQLRDRALDIAGRAAGLDCTGESAVTRGVVLQQAEAVVARVDAGLLAFSLADYQSSPIGRLLSALPEASPGGAAAESAYLARLAGIPVYLTAAVRRHRDGVAAGQVPVEARGQHALDRLDRYLDAPQNDPLRTPRLSASAAVERDRLLEAVVRPAFAAYRSAIAEHVVPYGRPQDRVGLCWLPGGERTYAALAATHTTTGHTADDLHRIGRELVEQLDAEYAAAGAVVLGLSDPAEVRARLRSDPALRWGTGDELIAAVRTATARAGESAPHWFGLLPGHPCVVTPAPDGDAPSAYYVPPALHGGRPGTCYVNVDGATSRGRYLVEATAFHETVPGHHIQFAVAQQRKGLPQLRRVAWVNAYIEGWGLYAERLADEMGLYSGQLARMGMLAMDSIRAARLVVDTGLHALGWSRDTAMEYLRGATLMSEREIQQETDRYIDMPGQALSYMVGRLEIQRLRAEARCQLGAYFSVADFHDVVLGGGALPLSVLDDVVQTWVAEHQPTTANAG